MMSEHILIQDLQSTILNLTSPTSENMEQSNV